MASLQLTTALMGLGLAALILLLVRRDRLYLMHGLFWVLVAALAAVNTRIERDVRRLNQRLALLEAGAADTAQFSKTPRL